MIKLAISGYKGRMGSRLLELASKDKDFEVVARIEKGDDTEPLKNADVLIEFTTPEATMSHLIQAVKYKKSVVIGTTGLTPEQIENIKEASRHIPILFSPNMSIGINLLFRFIGDIAKGLGKDYDIELIEAHHKTKVDAPSGTAKRFIKELCDATGKQIPAHSLRLGDIIGEHIIIFAGNSERIEITHKAHSRDVFALGALRGAKWLAKKPQGLYDMQDVLFTQISAR